jgi:hypothetical protein
LALAPALKVLQTAPQQHQALVPNCAEMQHLQAQRTAARLIPMPATDEVIRALACSNAGRVPTGAAAGRATVTLSGVPEALALRLASPAKCRTVPTQARLVHAAGAWDGTVVLQLAAP